MRHHSSIHIHIFIQLIATGFIVGIVTGMCASSNAVLRRWIPLFKAPPVCRESAEPADWARRGVWKVFG